MVGLKSDCATLKPQMNNYEISEDSVRFAALLTYLGRTFGYRRAKVQIDRRSGGLIFLFEIHAFRSPCFV